MIPAYNEEQTIGAVIKTIPRDCCGTVEVLVIDDGSSDKTVEAAKEAGADKIVSFSHNKGLAAAFKYGLEIAVKMKADIIVNIDADGQYDALEIPKLIKPILSGHVDVVLGSRFKGHIEYMPRQKRIANKIATFVTRHASGLAISDAQTGFRAFTKEAALRLNILSDYTYVQETLIQLAQLGMKVEEVPVEFRQRSDSSRLISSVFGYAKRASGTIIRTYRDYQPLKTFIYIGGFIMLLGFILGLRVLINFFATGMVEPYLPSAILTILLLITGFQTIVVGILADMFKSHRKIQDEIMYRIKKIENGKSEE
jgi:glycosyltransferase involved in cell wall biosynthesis